MHVCDARLTATLVSLSPHTQVVKSAEILGFYVSPEVWCKLVLPAVRTSAGCKVGGTDQGSTVPVGPVQCTSCLTVLAALVRGARREALQPYLQVSIQKPTGNHAYRHLYTCTCTCAVNSTLCSLFQQLCYTAALLSKHASYMYICPTLYHLRSNYPHYTLNAMHIAIPQCS